MNLIIKWCKRFFIKRDASLATGVSHGVLFLNALGLQDKKVRSLKIKIDATDVIEIEAVILATVDNVDELITILHDYKKVNA